MGRPQEEREVCWRNLIITNKLTIYCVLHTVLSDLHSVPHLTISSTRKVPLLPKWVQIQQFSPGHLTFKLNLVTNTKAILLYCLLQFCAGY